MSLTPGSPASTPPGSRYFVVGRSLLSTLESYSTVLYEGDDSSLAYSAYYAAVEVAKQGGYGEALLYEQQPERKRRVVPGHRFVAAEWRAFLARPALAAGFAPAMSELLWHARQNDPVDRPRRVAQVLATLCDAVATIREAQS